MSLLDIHVLGSPILRQETTLVTAVTPELQELIDRMVETMYEAKGIGLAAPQVGRSERIAVIDVDDAPFAIINPEIILKEGSEKAEEGCLSIPDVYGDVERPARVIVRALDRNGGTFEVEGTELLGRCLQHEIDHLHGRLFIDHMGAFKRRAALAKWGKIKAKYPDFIRRLPDDDVAHPDEEL